MSERRGIPCLLFSAVAILGSLQSPAQVLEESPEDTLMWMAWHELSGRSSSVGYLLDCAGRDNCEARRLPSGKLPAETLIQQLGFSPEQSGLLLDHIVGSLDRYVQSLSDARGDICRQRNEISSLRQLAELERAARDGPELERLRYLREFEALVSEEDRARLAELPRLALNQFPFMVVSGSLARGDPGFDVFEMRWAELNEERTPTAEARKLQLELVGKCGPEPFAVTLPPIRPVELPTP
jgi:hypothetical protein